MKIMQIDSRETVTAPWAGQDETVFRIVQQAFTPDVLFGAGVLLAANDDDA